MDKVLKIAAAVVGVVLVFVGLSIGAFSSQIVGLVVLLAGIYAADWGLGVTRRWRARKAKREAPKYTPKGGGM